MEALGHHIIFTSNKKIIPDSSATILRVVLDLSLHMNQVM